MATRRNGGIKGVQNRTTNVSGSGAWSMDDVQQSLLAANWPGGPLPSVPNSPVITSITASSSSTATLNFALGYNGGSTITSVTAVATPGNITGTISGTTSPATFTGLTPGQSYTFYIYCTNSIGNSTNNYQPFTMPNQFNYLIAAGGGSGGTQTGGGGGAGGVLTGFVLSPSGTYTITVGAGGASPGAVDTVPGNNGSNSVIQLPSSTTYTALGGGGGGAYRANAAIGGSGGGGNHGQFASGTGAAGTTGQGNAGGNGGYDAGNVLFGGGGGGGAGAVGTNVVLSTTVGKAGSGGTGITTTLISTTLATSAAVGQVSGGNVYFAGGGGGGWWSSTYSSTGSPGGLGGGGYGANDLGTNNLQAVAGTAYTGGGGGAGGYNGVTEAQNVGYAGGSGVVIISADRSANSTTGSPTTSTSGNQYIYIFKGNGTITF